MGWLSTSSSYGAMMFQNVKSTAARETSATDMNASTKQPQARQGRRRLPVFCRFSLFLKLFCWPPYFAMAIKGKTQGKRPGQSLQVNKPTASAFALLNSVCCRAQRRSKNWHRVSRRRKRRPKLRERERIVHLNGSSFLYLGPMMTRTRSCRNKT